MAEICLMTKAWRSGAAWVAQMTAQAIAEQGATITFIAPRAEPASRDPVHERLQRVRTPRELVGTHSKPRRVVASLKRIGAGFAAVCRARATTRTFVFSIPDPLAVTLPLFALLRVSGARVVYVAHDSQPHAWSLPRRLRRLERAAHAWSYRLADTVVALTPTVKAALVRDFRVPARKVEVIPHGPFLLGKVSPVQGTRRLLVFGSLRGNKSVLEVIEAVVRARRQGLPVRLVLAGEPLKQEPGYWESCVDAMRQDPDAFEVHRGFMADEDIPGLLEGIDAFVLAYRDFESQSGVAILATLAGRPVIGTRAGGLGELFDRGMAGEVISDPATPDAIAESISAFYRTDVEAWRLAAQAASAAIADLLRWDRIADSYVKLARGG